MQHVKRTTVATDLERAAPRYTVVVLFPHKLREDHCVYVAYVHAYSVQQACSLATLEAMLGQPPEQRGVVTDWKVLCAFYGHPNLEEIP